LATAVGVLLEYREYIRRVGNGGPRVLQQESVNGPLYPVQTAAATNCVTRQQGSAIGYLTKPGPNPPYWPQYLINPNEAVDEGTPRLRGRLGTEWPVSWNYEFHSPFPLRGTPLVR
jgi:hypothetical protein